MKPAKKGGGGGVLLKRLAQRPYISRAAIWELNFVATIWKEKTYLHSVTSFGKKACCYLVGQVILPGTREPGVNQQPL